MNQFQVLPLLLVGFVIGFVAGFVACVFMSAGGAAWQRYRMAVESRRNVKKATEDLMRIAAEMKKI